MEERAEASNAILLFGVIEGHFLTLLLGAQTNVRIRRNSFIELISFLLGVFFAGGTASAFYLPAAFVLG